MTDKKKLRSLVLIAIFAAVTTVVTLLIRIPIPNSQGYLNIGDGILMAVGLLFGPTVGFGVGAIGSALADLLAGYAIYAPFTFIVKGIEGFVAAYLYKRFRKYWPGLFIAGLVMALGYFFTDWILYGIAVASVSLPMNIGQGIFGALIAGILYPKFRKSINKNNSSIY